MGRVLRPGTPLEVPGLTALPYRPRFGRDVAETSGLVRNEGVRRSELRGSLGCCALIGQSDLGSWRWVADRSGLPLVRQGCLLLGAGSGFSLRGRGLLATETMLLDESGRVGFYERWGFRHVLGQVRELAGVSGLHELLEGTS